MEYHVPALLNECMTGLNIDPEGTYVDVTFGGGGHSKAIFERLTTGKLLVFDQDADAKANAKPLLEVKRDRSFTFIESNFRHLKKYLRFHGVTQVDGILADLGVSFHQFDQADRGFSTRFESELDMRMDQRQRKSAIEVINESNEADLIHLLSAYGEIKNARTLASRIVQARTQGKLERTEQLKEVALTVAPRGKEVKYLAQLYQAIRIEVNDEMGAVKELLEQSIDVLKPSGRLVVISYHSLEDRLVKNFMNAGNFQGKQEKDFYGNLLRPLDPVNRKPLVPTQEEVNANNRSRSAKLRIAEKRNGNEHL